MARFHRQNRTVFALRIIWVITLLWNESATFTYTASKCSWPVVPSVSPTSKPSHILVVADPQILDHNSYPDRGVLLTFLSRIFTDLNLRRSWRAARGKTPDAVVFLGDMMDNGRAIMSDAEYEQYYHRFNSIFAQDRAIPRYYVPGNHDTGIGVAERFSPNASTRYLEHFGALNHVQHLAGHTLVFIDAPGLVAEDTKRTEQGIPLAQWNPVQGGPIEFIHELSSRLITGENSTILFTHIPLARPEGSNCGPLRERGTIHRGGGIGYENMLGKEMSQFILERLGPSVIYSGDDHDYCEYGHEGRGSTRVREVTVKSLSMAMGIRQPGFQMVSLVPRKDLADKWKSGHADGACVMPDQLGIYLGIYVPLIVISVAAVLLSVVLCDDGEGRGLPTPALMTSSKRGRRRGRLGLALRGIVERGNFYQLQRLLRKCYPAIHAVASLSLLLSLLPSPMQQSPLVPPLYSRPTSFNTPAPSYSSLPLIDEETIEYSPRPGSPPLPQGSYTRHWHNTTLVLDDQDESAQFPSYGRNACVNGHVVLEDNVSVLSVILKLEGRLHLSISDGGRSNSTLVSSQHVLWKCDNPTGKRCPSMIPFSIRFPSSYPDGGRNRRLPPSYQVSYHGIPAITAKCSYSLSLMITRIRYKRVSFWTSCKTRTLCLNYRPRSRPHRPILPISSLFSTIKPLPEEWRQIVTEIKTRPGSSTLSPISCHFFIPSVQTFGLADTIPFHIQLTGPLESLHAFLPPDSAELSPVSSGSKSSFRNPNSHLLHRPAIRVSIARQVLVEVHERKSWRSSTLGEGSVWPVPPSAPSFSVGLGPDSSRDVTIDWAGEVKCDESVSSVGFSTGGLVIKDFLVFALTPSNPRTSPLLELQHAHPIKFVTDPWIELDLHPLDR